MLGSFCNKTLKHIDLLAFKFDRIAVVERRIDATLEGIYFFIVYRANETLLIDVDTIIVLQLLCEFQRYMRLQIWR